jgi:hypothetical protein
MNILDLSPQEFEVYLAESDPAPERRKFLLDEYQKRRSGLSPFFSALESADAEMADEERRRLNLLPASVPEGMSFFDAVRAGEAEFATPGMFMSAGEEIARGVDMPAATLTGPVSRESMEEVAPAIAETMALGALPGIARAAREGVDPSTTRMFIGQGTSNPYAEDAMFRARELFLAGEDPETIWSVTSQEFPGTPASVMPDGTPFYEVSDEASRVLEASPEERASARPLSEVLASELLYEDVPRMGEVPTELEGSGMEGYRGLYNPDYEGAGPRIKIATGMQNKPKEQRGVLLHETQHAVARETGLPAGTNPERQQYFINQALEPERQLQRDLNATGESFLKQVQDLNLPTNLALPFLQRLDKNAAQIADSTRQSYLKIANAAKQPQTGQYGGARGLYYRSPGEALARLTDLRADYPLEKRRRISPMRTLSMDPSNRIDWENLTTVESPQDVRNLFGVEQPEIEGLPASSYVEAVDVFSRNQLPDIIDDAREALRAATDPAEQDKIVEQTQQRIDKIFNKALTSYK